ncbi:MAG: FlgD immunoglobulin-like domain containing protein [bacterium]
MNAKIRGSKDLKLRNSFLGATLLGIFQIIFLTNFCDSFSQDRVNAVLENKENTTSITPFPFSEDFENGLDNWLVSGQDWDTTSAMFNSPDHSVTDSPNGNYPPNANASITLANAIDLSSATVPVLTFWHKFDTNINQDFCRVEISKDFGFTWTEITNFTGTNSTWNLVQLDLSSFTASPIMIRFRLTSDDHWQFDGWYIDDVEIKELNTSLTPFPFFDDFENGLSNWLASSQNWDTTSVMFSGPTHSVTESPDGDFPPNANASITLANAIDLSSAAVPVLTFWHKFDTNINQDFCRVEISKDFGFTWTEITNFTGTNSTWNLVQLDLSSFTASPIMIRFRLTSDDHWQFDGWYIDDVEIKELNTSLTPFPFFDDFENGLSNWLASSQNWHTTSAMFSSPDHSVTDSPNGNYPPNANASITLANAIDLSSATIPALTFWHKFDTNINQDFCRVEISKDFGFTWTEITNFTGTNSTWNLVQLDLSSFTASPIMIRFRLTSDDHWQFDGWYIDDVGIGGVVDGVDDNPSEIPNEYALLQNYPNPFNPETVIRYQLPKPGHVKLVIYNQLGKRVRSLVNSDKVAGNYQVQWDGRNDSGKQVASGIYVYQLRAGDFVASKKLLLMR